ncbi:hypothetical protein HHK36_010080 [Tetracentron sinense]|uniref:Homeobox-leucine zipper protein n=1 Tax=Tetracentron sinense TaxID=13715 RepID=A0A834ZG96_TETSI|nr:hypothetical protein HHK36_010080 [Tetracentron sinense]
MKTNMNNEEEDQMLLISQFYPGFYTQMAPEEGEKRRRQRRKKNREASNIGARKRKLSAEQVNLLEMNFGNEHKLESKRKDQIASELRLDPRQVAVWFQNRRAKWKSQQLEEEYSKLQTVHESVFVEKCRLESEVLKLKEQLSEAEKEIQRLSERSDGISNGSPSSSLSMDVDTRFLGEFGVEGFENVCYIPENSYIHEMEWGSLYYM